MSSVIKKRRRRMSHRHHRKVLRATRAKRLRAGR